MISVSQENSTVPGKKSFTSLDAWFVYCYSQLDQRLKNTESFALLDSFSGELKLKANRLFQEGRSRGYFWYQLAYESLRAQVPAKVKKSHYLEFKPQKDQKLDIFFWPWQRIHWEYLKPIKNRAQLEGLRVSVSSNNDIVREALKDENSIESNLTRLKRLSFLKDPKAMFILQESKSLPAFKAKNGRVLKFSDLVIEAFRNHFQLYQETLRSYQSLLRNCNPRALFLGNPSTLVGATVWNQATKDGLKVYSIMHGALNADVNYGRSDTFFVFGQKDLEYLQSKSYDTSKVLVTGSPKLDGLEERLSEKSKDYVLVAVSGPGHSVSYDNHFKTIELLGTLIAAYPEEKFIVKLHKKDKKKYYSDLFTYQNLSVLSPQEQGEKSDIFEWLASAKVLITGASTSALDAMNLNVPVLSINIDQSLNHFPMIDQGIILSTDEPTELNEVLGNLLNNSDFQKEYLKKGTQFVEGYYANMDSSKKIVDHLKIQLN